MDIQARKLNLIEYLISLKDEGMLSRIEHTVFNESIVVEADLKPFTKEQLLDRAKKANDDFAAGRFITQEELEKKASNW